MCAQWTMVNVIQMQFAPMIQRLTWRSAPVRPATQTLDLIQMLYAQVRIFARK